MSEHHFSSEAFALRVEVNDWQTFPLHSLLLIEPDLSPQHGDYVLVCKIDQQYPIIKQIIFEDEVTWLKSINIADHIIPLLPMYQILGVIIECRKQLKIYFNGE